MDLPSSAERGPVTGGSGELNDGASLSGHERNHLFLNDGDGALIDISGTSGLDDPADGRAVGWLDFDRDGWLDFAVVNANAPTLQLYRNQIGDLARAQGRGEIAMRLVGGNRSPSKSAEWSNRDGIGARIEVHLGERTLVRELRAGEGFASQNSATLHVGIGKAESVDKITVRWPSGRTQSTDGVARNTLVTFYENPKDNAERKEATVASRGPKLKPSRPTHTGTPVPLGLSKGARTSPAKLRVITTTATWCESCRNELPDIARLRDAFPSEELDLVALPVDENDTAEKLREYTARLQPKYRMLYEPSQADRKAVTETIESTLRTDVLPASVVTNDKDEVLGVYWGLPTVSDLKAIQNR